MTRQHLNAHEYYQSADIQQLQPFDNLHLLEFKELKLKSMSRFETAISWMLETELKNYLEKYSVMMPGDQPNFISGRLSIQIHLNMETRLVQMKHLTVVITICNKIKMMSQF